jgi:hypothetical protein
MMAEYFSKMRNYADDMAAAGKSLGDEEFVAYVLTRLNEEIYNAFMSSIVMRVEPISPSKLFSQMISYELRLNKKSSGGYSQAFAYAATRGRGAPWSHGGNTNFGRGRGRSMATLAWSLSWGTKICQLSSHARGVQWPVQAALSSVLEGRAHRGCLLVQVR